ncbi:MAG: hypothetical protein K2L19_01540 [Eubacterium sp.]|nr:hypothetical protein [Eubacterium sp.]
MKKSRVLEEKQINIFIIGFIVFLVFVIGFVVFMVHHSKNKPEENLSDTSVSVTQHLSKHESEALSESTTSQPSTKTNNTEKTTQRAKEESTSKQNSTSRYNVDMKAERERYQKECDAINKKYDEMILEKEIVKERLNTELSMEEDKLELIYKELDIISAVNGAEVDYSSNSRVIEQQAKIDDLADSIAQLDREIEQARADRNAELLAAEKAHLDRIG